MLVKKIRKHGFIRIVKIVLKIIIARLRGIFFGIINTTPCFPRGLRVGKNVRSTVRYLEVGDNISIGDHCSFGGSGKIVLGDNIALNRNVHMDAADYISIGNNTLIGPDCYLVDSNHILKNKSALISSDVECRPIKIGDDVWLGRNVTILAGCKVGRLSVLGAGAVLTKSMPDNSIAKGVPAIIDKI